MGFEEQLIKLVRNYQELYDPSHIKYMKNRLKQKIWDSIAKKLNLSNGEEAKTYWTKLRNNHRDALRRHRRMISTGTPPADIKPWKFESQMGFLLKYMMIYDREMNFCKDDDQTRDADDPTEEVNEELPPPHTANVEGGDSANENSPEPPPRPPPLLKRKVKKINIDHIIKTAIEQRDRRAKERSEERRRLEERLIPTDDLYLFFLSVYEQTKRMPLTSQHNVRKNIFLAVSHEEAQLLSISEQSAFQQDMDRSANNHLQMGSIASTSSSVLVPTITSIHSVSKQESTDDMN